MFRSALRYLKFKPEDGLQVVARGKISVYDPKGEYQIVCEHMEPQGLGALQLAFEQLKKKLAAEGLFDQARKRPLPALPRRIGIVTSIDGAALRDIIRVLRRRYPNAHLVISPTRVQGEGAGREIARAIRKVARIEARRRGHRRPRRRIARRPLGVQRRSAGARDRRLAGAGDLGRRPRDRLHDRRLRRRPARADAVGGRGARGPAEGRVLRAHRPPRRAARRGDASPAAAPRIAAARARGAAGLCRAIAGRLAVRGRHVAELAAALRQRDRPGRWRGARAGTSCCAARSISSIRGIGWRGAHAPGLARRRSCRRRCGGGCTRAQARFGALAARLDGLSPLAVLGRGYAVTWDASRTRIIRDASTLDARRRECA